MRSMVKITGAVVLSLALSACASLDFSSRTKRQGNLSAVHDVNKLKIGMSKKQVAGIMGTSLIEPLFKLDRWDYTNTTQKPRQKIVIHSVSLYFRNGALSKIERQ